MKGIEDILKKISTQNTNSVSKSLSQALSSIKAADTTDEFTLTFTRIERFECLISADDPIALRYLNKYASAIASVREYDYRARRTVDVQKEVKYTTYFNGSLRCKLGLGVAIYRMFQSGSDIIPAKVNLIDNTGLSLDSDSPKFKFSDKWRTIYANHPKGEEAALIQQTTADEMEISQLGIIGLFTGAGKSEVLIGAAESLSEQSHNVIIFTYSNKVKEEIILRAERYGVEIPWDVDVARKINIVNPMGFCRSNKFKSKEIQDYLKSVDVIIADEAHHFTASSWALLAETIDPLFLYGFTATGDIQDGVSLLPESFNFNTGYSCVELINFASLSLIERELTVPIKLFNVLVSMSDSRDAINKFQEDHPDYMSGSMHLHLGDMKTAEAIKRTYLELFGGTGICYIPIVQVDNGIDLCKNLNSIGIETVFFSSSCVYMPLGEAEGLTLDELKQLARECAFKVLITTSVGVEGIDIANLDSIIPLTGKSYRQTIQSIGRSARGNMVKCACFFDKFNHMLNRQMKVKYDTIKTRLRVISEVKVNFRK